MKSIGSKLSVVATLLFLVGLFASTGPLSATASAQVSGTQVTWLIGEKAIPSMQTRTWHGVTTLSVLASLPAPIIILTAQPDDNGIMNECATGHPTVYETGAPAGQWGFSKVHYMYRYTAECQLAIDLAATKVGPDAHGAIPGWVDWIMYDNEICTLPGTPINEQEAPPTYYLLAAGLAHANNLKFMATAGLHKAPSGTTSQCTSGSTNDASDIWPTAAATPYPSTGWDAVDFQLQTGIADATTMLSGEQTQASNLEGMTLASGFFEVEGIGDLGHYYIADNDTKYFGPIDRGTQEVAIQSFLTSAVNQTGGLGVGAFWGNYGAHPQAMEGAGNCTDPTSGVCPMPDMYDQYADIIVDTYLSMWATPTGTYPQSPF